MTLADLIDTTLEEVGYQPSTASPEVRLRVRRRLNEWHRRLLAQPGLSRFLRETFSVTFASVASTAVYGLPSSVGRINSLYETTNDVKLEQRSLSWLRTEDPGLFRQLLEDRVILVTGAGCSIGSELTRLIVKWAPRRLVLV